MLATSGVVVEAGLTGPGRRAALAQSGGGSSGGSEELPSYPTDESDPAWDDNQPPTVPSGAVEVLMPDEGMVRAGALPVLVGAAESGSPSRVLVTVFDQPTVTALGGAYVAFRVARADGGSVPARIRVAVDYASVARAAGGHLPTRLFLRRLPACSLSAPAHPACLEGTPVGTRNDLDAQQLHSGEVVVEPDPGALEPGPGYAQSTSSVYSMSSASSGSAGDYTSSPLLGSDKWQVGTHTGNFSYEYPLPMPPAVAGPVPELSLTYSSQSVDGRTASQNAQPSQVGEGWSFGAGHIDRRFGGCAEDVPNSQWGDLCHGKVEYFLTLNGQASELVRQTSNLWRLRDDPAWRIESRTSSPSLNGSNAGDYWIVTTPDGTRYWFGRGVAEPTSNLTATNSAWNVPVFGDDPGEPCYSSAGIAVSWCYQTWRWNLDRIEDTHGNVASLFYGKEQNYYRRMNTASLATRYDRAGHLTEVHYSKRVGAESATAVAPSRVVVTMASRCYEQTSCPAATSANAAAYPDVPFDLSCTDPAGCSGAGQAAPSFWSTKQVGRIETYMADPSYLPLDRIDFAYEFPATGESGTSPVLWLQSVQRTGLRETPNVLLPPVTFGGVNLPNRVDNDPANGVPATNKHRVTSIISEIGGQVVVGYGLPHGCDKAYASSQTGKWDTNYRNCFPQSFTPTGGEPGTGIFHKYHATRVELRDLAAQGPAQITNYLYLSDPGRDGGAGWRHEDSLVTLSAAQSWSDYRGYEQVEVRTGSDPAAPLTRTRYRTFRGLDGDRLVGGDVRDEEVVDADAIAHPDHHYLAGRRLEAVRITPTGTEASVTHHRYGATQTVAGPAGTTSIPHNAQYVRETNRFTKTRNEAKTIPVDWLVHRVDHTYDTTYGLVATSLDYGDLDSSADDACVKPMRTPNADAWIIDAPYRVEKYAATCTGGLMGRTDTYYDDNVHAARPDKGAVTAVATWPRGDHRLISRWTYDGLGRVTGNRSPKQETDPTPVWTTTTYSGSPFPTTTKVTHPGNLVVETGRWRDRPGAVKDPNGHATTPAYDALGRVSSVTRPLDPAGTPGLAFIYYASRTAPSQVRTRTLQNATSYLDSFSYLDGWGRTREIQVPAPNTAPTSSGGRIVTATRYDERGHVTAVSQPFHRTGNAGESFVDLAPGLIPREERYGYDGLDRREWTAQWASNAEKWRTTTRHYGFYVQVDSPERGRVIRRLDALGRVRRVEETLGTGALVTRHDYSRRGDLATITDAKGNVTSYTYDWLGRRTASSDPDQGSWTYGYDDNGNPTTVTDAAKQTVTTTYDDLDRRAGLSGPGVSAVWTYDAAAGVANPKGRLVRATTGGHEVAITGYDARGRVLGSRTTVGSAVTALAGTYTVGYGYDQANRVSTISYPEVGGLAAETVTATYDAAGFAATLSGRSMYVARTLYEPDGQLAGRDLGATSGTGATAVATSRRYTYDDAAARLATTETTVGSTTVESTAFAYDRESNVIGVRDSGQVQWECFDYDDLNRLVRAFTTEASSCTGAAPNHLFGPGPYDHTYTYDDIGNLTKIEDGRTPTETRYYTPSSVRPHALASVGTTTDASDVFAVTYDDNGATDKRTLGTATIAAYTFDARHLLTQVTANDSASTTGFVYDADGNAMLRIEDPDTSVTDDTVTTLYLDGMEVRRVGSEPPTATRYYGSAALRTTTGATTDQGLWWLANSHQASTALAVHADSTDAGGLPRVRRRRYLPYGGTRDDGDTLPTERGFLGKPEADGLVHLGARHYDPGTGRFLSVDPVLNVAEPLSLNGYAYARNNPATLVDPSGLEPYEYQDDDGNTVGWGGMGCVYGCIDTRIETRINRERAAQAEVDRVTARYQKGTRGYYEAVMTGCGYATFAACETRHHRRIAEIANGIYSDEGMREFAEFLGLGDASRCVGGSLWSCVIFAISVVPPGKISKLARLDEAATAHRAIGYSDEAVASAFVRMRVEGGHAIRHLRRQGMISATGRLADQVQEFIDLTTPILTNPLKTFDWKLGNTMSRGFAGQIGGRTVVVFVAKNGDYQGKVISAFVPSARQMIDMGLG